MCVCVCVWGGGGGVRTFRMSFASITVSDPTCPIHSEHDCLPQAPRHVRRPGTNCPFAADSTTSHPALPSRPPAGFRETHEKWATNPPFCGPSKRGVPAHQRRPRQATSWSVEHATSYEVSWTTESSDSLNAIAGPLPRVSGTSATIQQDAAEPMTLTVTVIPEYVDKIGGTQQLNNLAGNVTPDIGAVGQGRQAIGRSRSLTHACPGRGLTTKLHAIVL